MEDPAQYQALLDEAIGKRRAWLESSQIPLFKDTLSSLAYIFEGVMQLLIRKGLLREDPYNYDQGITEIAIPKDDELPEFENSDELSYRLAAFRRQLKFVCTEYPLELPSLGLARLKKLSSLVSYINWLDMGESSRSPTTKAFARVFMKVRMGSDTMASQVLKDSEIQITRTTHVLRTILAELIAFSRESWKADVRRVAHTELTAGTSGGQARREDTIRSIRRVLAAQMPDKHWYPSLAEEVADEELAEDAEARRQKVLASLAVAAPQPRKVTEAPDGKAILLEAVRLLSRPNEELVTAITVLQDTEGLLASSRGSGVGWLRRLFGVRAPKNADRVYKLKYAEPGEPAPRTETLDFPAFAAEVRKKSSLLASLAPGSGQAFKRLAATSESRLAEFLDRQLNELLLIHRRLDSMNTLFQTRMTQEKKTARGIKIELLTLRNAIVKANQRRHEYREKDAGTVDE